METDSPTERDSPMGSGGKERSWSRRETLAGLVGLLVTPALLRSPGRRPIEPAGSQAGSGSVDLPPRTIGLRSLGGAFRFDPPGLRIAPGDTVIWLNIGDFHTVTAFHPDNADLFPGEIPLRIPVGAPSFHSGMLGLDAGSRFEHRFDRPGVYDYFCQPHYSFGMVGRVVVGERADADPASLSALNEPSRRELPPLDDVFGARGTGFEWASRINGVLALRADRAGDIAPRARALGDELDAEVAGRLGPAEADTFRATLDRWQRNADGGDYETLVRLSDELKRSLY